METGTEAELSSTDLISGMFRFSWIVMLTILDSTVAIFSDGSS